ncbi:hypothetical protein D3C87_1928540 [compost metagenome]
MLRAIVPKVSKFHVHTVRPIAPDSALFKYRDRVQALRAQMAVIETHEPGYLTHPYWLLLQERMNLLIKEAKLVLRGSSEPKVE